MAENRTIDNSGLRVVFDARGSIQYRGTGIGTYAYQLAFNLQQLKKERLDFLLPNSEFAGLDFTDSTVFTRMSNDPQYYKDEFLPEWLLSKGADLYHVPQNGIGLPLKAPCRKVVTIHDLIPYVYPESVGRGYLKEFLGEMPGIIKNTDGIIAVSQHTKKDILRFFDYPEDRITVIYEAAEPLYAPTHKNTCKGVLKRQYGIDTDYLLYVGGFGTRKNLSCLLVAFAEAVRELPKPCKLVCPGRSLKAKSYLKELAKALNIDDLVVFPGFVPVNVLPYFYGGAEALVYPSLYEGFGLPVLEAMACGCPVLISDNSSLREIGGDAAAYFNALDSKSVADAIIRVMNDQELLNQMSEKGLWHSAEFDWHKSAESTWAFYEKIAAMPPRR
jgi:glycosyltransferase involved in cell wall biosynthesis